MATWNGTPKKFNLERWDPKNHGYGHYEDVQFNWSYGTVSDSLTITETDSYGTKETHFGKWEAEAMLHTLAQWYGRYEGRGELLNLLKDILENGN